jgi:hypothetical protein
MRDNIWPLPARFAPMAFAQGAGNRAGLYVLALRSELRPWLARAELGWDVRWLLHAIDHTPDGKAHAFTAPGTGSAGAGQPSGTAASVMVSRPWAASQCSIQPSAIWKA